MTGGRQLPERRNEADRRVLELLSEKFKLFEGVSEQATKYWARSNPVWTSSGASLKSTKPAGTPRKSKPRSTGFRPNSTNRFRPALAQTREVLLENFDEDVSARLRVNRDKTLETLSDRERSLLELTRTELNGEARFEADRPRSSIRRTRPPGWYHFDWKKPKRSAIPSIGRTIRLPLKLSNRL